MSENKETKKKMVAVGPVPINPDDRADKYLLLSVNGKTIMLERGKIEKVPEEFAEAYEHRVAMQLRRVNARNRMAEELRKKQNEDGVSFK